MPRKKIGSPTRALMTGQKCRYRGKVRGRVITFTCTRVGLDALERGVRRSGLSRSDYLEMLVRAAEGVPDTA